MARIAWTARLRPDAIEAYERAHADVWPEVLAVIREAGARNYSIFRSGTTLFGILECDDPDVTRARMREGQRRLGWNEAMAPLFEPEVAERGTDLLTEVFHLD